MSEVRIPNENFSAKKFGQLFPISAEKISAEKISAGKNFGGINFGLQFVRNFFRPKIFGCCFSNLYENGNKF